MKKNSLKVISIAFVFAACASKTTDVKTEKSPTDTVETLSIRTEEPSVSKEEGLSTEYYENGKERIKGALKNGQRDGLWQAWYENGNLWSEAEYKNGINHGKSITYFENGKIRYEGKYDMGKKAGEWKYYDETGKLVKTIAN